MRRGFRAAAVAACGLSLTVLTPIQAAAEVAQPLRAEAEGAMQTLVGGECKTVPGAFDPVVTDAGFRGFDAETRSAILGGAAMCAISGGDVKAAYRYARLGADEPSADGAIWSVRFSLALANAEPADAVQSFHVLAAKYPQALGELDDNLILAAYQSLASTPAPDAQRLRFLDALRAGRWSPQDPMDTGAALRLEHVRLLLAANRAPAAAAEAAALNEPFSLLALRIDERFAPARPAAAADLRRAARDSLKRVTVASSAAPDRLSGPMAMAELHLMLNEPETALRVVDAALERHRKGGDSAFLDAERNLNWARDLRAQALFALGRWDDGLEAMAEGAQTQEDGAENFSQTVNLAGALTFAGRPQEALAALDAVNDDLLTDDGRAWVESARTCALAASRDADAASAAAAKADALGPRNFGARTHARLCVNDLDAAAKLYVARLADPEHRLEALLALQTYQVDAAVEATAPTAWGAERRSQLARLRARPDVLAAVAAAGGRIGAVEIVDVHGRL
jgi:hypothetical protein